MAPALSVRHMVIMLLETTELAKRTQVQVLEVLLGFLQDKITKTELIAGLIQAAGRPACKRALLTLGPQINYILHGDPLAEPHDYADPKYVECEARHCMTADDLRKIDEGRAAEWAAAQGPKLTAKVRALLGEERGEHISEGEYLAIQWRGQGYGWEGEKPRSAPVGLRPV